MATNKIQEGKVLQVAFTAGHTVGDPIRLGSVTGVLLETVTAGGTGSMAIGGAYDLTLTVTAAVTVGQALYLSASGGVLMQLSSAGALMGYALETASAGSTAAITVLLPRS